MSRMIRMCHFCAFKTQYYYEFPLIGVWCCKCNLGNVGVSMSATDADLDDARKWLLQSTELPREALDKISEISLGRAISRIGSK